MGGVIARFQELKRRKEEEELWNLEHCRLARDDPSLVRDDVTCRRPDVEYYNVQKKEINHRGMKPREMPNHKTAQLPAPIEGGTFESKLQVWMEDLKEGAKKYIEEHCDKKGAQENNLSKEEKEGLDSLKRRLKEEVVVSMTDKSGNLSADTKENYKESMQTHVEQDKVVTREEHDSVEKVMNAHSKQICRVLMIGREHGEKCADECKHGTQTSDSKISDLKGLRKDHKRCDDVMKGPPLRPICGASEAMNAPPVSYTHLTLPTNREV